MGSAGQASDRPRRAARGLSRWCGEHTHLFEADPSRRMGLLPERFRWTDWFVPVATSDTQPRDRRWLLPIRSRLWGLWRRWFWLVPPVCVQLCRMHRVLQLERDGSELWWLAVATATDPGTCATDPGTCTTDSVHR